MTSTTTNGPLDELLDIASNISMAIELHKSLTAELRDTINACFADGQEVDMIARNANISARTVDAWRYEWLATEDGREWLLAQPEAA